jgi:DNA primase
MGLCPFHGEKSPSFSVSPSKQFYHCFGCGKNGNVISFLMDFSGMGFVDAVKELAQQYGMQVPEEDASPEDRARAAARRERQQTLSDVLEKANAAYRKELKTAARAVDYLKGRGVSGQVAKDFGLGYAPEGWRSLASVFPHYDDPLLVESGLVIVSAPEDGGEEKRYDRFRDRVMFPIRNVKGECIGFGARVLGDEKPKYLNSPETPVFSKGRELYGLFEARAHLREAGYALVTEGYMDVVALAQLGFPNAVATLGTACTADHVQKLFRFTDAVVFSFDGDAAGRRAAHKALEAALPFATDVRSVKFLFLPPEHDPDSFVREHGPQGFAERLAGALPLSEFLIRELSSRVDLNMPEGRARFQADARPLLLAMPAVALRLQLLQAIAGKARVSTEDLVAFVSAGAKSDARGSMPAGWRSEASDSSRAAQSGARRDARPSTDSGADPQRPWQASRRRPASQAELPDLQRRVCFLLALQPSVAAEPIAMEFLPRAVVDWIGRLALLPAQTHFAGLIESLRETDPGLAESLQAQATRDRGLLADLDVEAVRIEVEGALNQLRAQGVRDEVDRLAASGLQDEAARLRYAELLALRKTLSAP